MALPTGYVFPTAASILPFIEHPGASPSTDACTELARRLQCHVIAGYPAPPLTIDESKQQAEDGTTPKSSDRDGPSGQGVARNSAVVVEPTGKVIHTYAKTNMFESDLPWAQPGSGFSTFTTSVQAFGTLSVAICMDLNPHPPNMWTSMDGPYELADYCIENEVQTLVLLCAWLDSGRSEDTPFDGSTASYWIARLRPFWYAGTDKYTVIICNRTGTERGSTFAGTSTVLRSQSDKQLPKILTMMGKEEEAVRIVDLVNETSKFSGRDVMTFRA
ncbi:Carbon-nitrogen hydrolase [Ceratobasidium sp. 392]|nr:Carbon-nitrogen hydrolase [Ceratobasidium sp. 392]